MFAESLIETIGIPEDWLTGIIVPTADSSKHFSNHNGNGKVNTIGETLEET